MFTVKAKKKKSTLFSLCGQYTLKFNHQLLLSSGRYSFAIIRLFAKIRVHPWGEFILNEETRSQISHYHITDIHLNIFLFKLHNSV